MTIDTASAHTVYATEAKAESVASELRKTDPDWAYVVSVDPLGSGRAIVKVYDESGEFLHNL